MRPIDADALKKRLLEKGFYPAIVKRAIEDAPVVDAVVRCKDCIYEKDAKWNRNGFRICPATHMEIVDDDFCSYGERKEKNNDTD